jgi:hypothetical protein
VLVPRAFFLLLLFIVMLQHAALAQTNCPSGIQIHVNSGDTMISIWSPISNGDYYLSRAWDMGTHVGKDRYSLDLSMPGSQDLGKAVFLPMTGRVWAVKTSGAYGNTAMIWDPGSGILLRLAHMVGFSSATYAASGFWFGAGTKVGYIGETGCPGCGPHLHVTAYRNVMVGAWTGSRAATEQDIINSLSKGATPSFAQPQKFRLIAPSDNCDLIRFDGNPTVYTQKDGTLYPVTSDVWRSWGLSLDLRPREGQFDQTAGRIPVRVLPAYQRGWYYINSQLASPRTESVFRGYRYPDTYVYRWGQKNFLSANQFGDQSWYEYRWSEVQVMDQNFVDQLYPRTFR